MPIEEEEEVISGSMSEQHWAFVSNMQSLTADRVWSSRLGFRQKDTRTSL